MAKTRYCEWDRMFYDGIYQFIFEDDNKNVIETCVDVSSGKCKEGWDYIVHKDPEVYGYKAFCKCYRKAKEEWDAYCKRDERRYRRFWTIGGKFRG